MKVIYRCADRPRALRHYLLHVITGVAYVIDELLFLLTLGHFYSEFGNIVASSRLADRLDPRPLKS